MLNQIKEKLEEYAFEQGYEDVSYGKMANVPDRWNYIVFSRDVLEHSKSSSDFKRKYSVAIVHEEYIPEEDEIKLIKKLEEIKGLHFSESNIEYDYEKNPKTDNVVELAVLIFVENLKGYLVRSYD